MLAQSGANFAFMKYAALAIHAGTMTDENSSAVYMAGEMEK
jgi:hypothetical protein